MAPGSQRVSVTGLACQNSLDAEDVFHLLGRQASEFPWEIPGGQVKPATRVSEGFGTRLLAKPIYTSRKTCYEYRHVQCT